MATAKVLPQIEVQSLAADVKQTCDELEKEKESHLSINYVSYNSDELHNRHTSLQAKLGKVTSRVYTKASQKQLIAYFRFWTNGIKNSHTSIRSYHKAPPPPNFKIIPTTKANYLV